MLNNAHVFDLFLTVQKGGLLGFAIMTSHVPDQAEKNTLKIKDFMKDL